LSKRDEKFITRAELMERWRLGQTEIFNREKSGQLKPYKFSYKVVRYKLSDIIRIEEEAAKTRPEAV
jgi:hypothetical protein